MSEFETARPGGDGSAEPETCAPAEVAPAPSPGSGTAPPAANRGNAGKGRPKGSLNKVTLAAREAILLAAEGLGGVDGLVAWARKNDDNERIFWSVIYPKVLPYGGGPCASAAAAVTGALVWRRPDGDETAPPAIAAAGAAAQEAGATPAPVAATVVWKAPEPGAPRALPGLPGGPPVATADARTRASGAAAAPAAEGGATTSPAPPRPPPET